MSRYAENTKVPVDRSVQEIQRVLQRYGASAFGYGWQGDRALVEFMADDRRIRFLVQLPDPDDDEFQTTPSGRRRRDADAARSEWEKACRQRWRALTLAVKAKLEAVESEIASFEEEFAAYIVLPDGRTTWEHMGPAIAEAYESGRVPEMLALPRGETT
ncbi:MAG: hypothetical protein GY795_24665 [Desulfobacterales bacterium]|nr:hypothetical protein [Desulfobacterales bacterium]